jgi:predicted Fe-S protein YdhL (DUF1289 family)
MPLVHQCKTDGCDVLTMGDYCLGCERDQEVAFLWPLSRESDSDDLAPSHEQALPRTAA